MSFPSINVSNFSIKTEENDTTWNLSHTRTKDEIGLLLELLCADWNIPIP